MLHGEPENETTKKRRPRPELGSHICIGVEIQLIAIIRTKLARRVFCL
jgi:hypothetical protein